MGQVPSDLNNLVGSVRHEFFDSRATSTPPNEDGAFPQRSASPWFLAREEVDDLVCLA